MAKFNRLAPAKSTQMRRELVDALTHKYFRLAGKAPQEQWPKLLQTLFEECYDFATRRALEKP